MRGPAPKPANERRRTNKPVGDWKPAPEGGWRFGDAPEAPDGSTSAMRETWALWFSSWWAAWWELEDVPTVELALRAWGASLNDPAQVPKFTALSKGLGLSPKDRHDLRWLPPEAEDAEGEKPASVHRLKVVDKGA